MFSYYWKLLHIRIIREELFFPLTLLRNNNVRFHCCHFCNSRKGNDCTDDIWRHLERHNLCFIIYGYLEGLFLDLYLIKNVSFKDFEAQFYKVSPDLIHWKDDDRLISTHNRNGRHPTILANFADDASKKGKSSNDKKEEKAKTADNPDDKKEVTSKRLNDLLAEMSDESNLKIVKEVIKPRSSAEKKARKQAAVDDKKESKPPNIAEAAKLVAKTLGGDVKKTESELLSILMKSDHKKGDKDLR